MHRKLVQLLTATALLPSSVLTQQVQQDPREAGPSLEPVHYYYDEWPTGERAVEPTHLSRLTVLQELRYHLRAACSQIIPRD